MTCYATRFVLELDMDKQQTICLKLAQWIGFNPPGAYAEQDDVFGYRGATEFNPFANTTEGRAQFAECVVKAAWEFHNLEVYDKGVEARNGQGGKCFRVGMGGIGVAAATLEAIYYAIDGTDTWSGA
jgi:hypothetical protein